MLYLDVERFANPELSIRGGVPILFPICGNLPDNCYTYNGQQYTLKQHGFGRYLPWEVTE
jgi:galactose mutarotase-like enzyme